VEKWGNGCKREVRRVYVEPFIVGKTAAYATILPGWQKKRPLTPFLGNHRSMMEKSMAEKGVRGDLSINRNVPPAIEFA